MNNINNNSQHKSIVCYSNDVVIIRNSIWHLLLKLFYGKVNKVQIANVSLHMYLYFVWNETHIYIEGKLIRIARHFLFSAWVRHGYEKNNNLIDKNISCKLG